MFSPKPGPSGDTKGSDMTYTTESVANIILDDRWDIELSNGIFDKGEKWTWSPQMIGWAVVVDYVNDDGHMQTRLEPVIIDDRGSHFAMARTMYDLAIEGRESDGTLDYPAGKITRKDAR